MGSKRGILWFRLDLRLGDNEALYDALRMEDEIIPVYVFDERKYRRLESGLLKRSPYQTQFIIEAVCELREKLRELGSELIVRIGKPEEVIFEMTRECRANSVFCNRERTAEELYVQEALEENLWTIGRELRFSRGKMLYYTQDLPFPITQTPDQFSILRKEIERIVPVRKLISRPVGRIQPFTCEIDPGKIPSLNELGYDIELDDDRAFLGGETKGIVRLEQVTKAIGEGIKTKMQISPWLGVGCVSPKEVFHSLSHLNSRQSEPTVKELKRNLLIRDFHRLMAKKYRNKLFQPGGLAGRGFVEKEANFDKDKFRSWIYGETEETYVNACMRELATTGFLKHQQRRVVAHYLIRQLKLPWTCGAAYFESVLIDYDPTSNYGNWQRIAGVSLDQKGEADVNIETFAAKYDPNGSYRTKWLQKEVPGIFYA